MVFVVCTDNSIITGSALLGYGQGLVSQSHIGITWRSGNLVYGGFLGMLTAWCEEHDVPYEGVPVGTIKRYATGKGNADKAKMVAAIQARGFRPADDNEADAIALLLWATERTGGRA